MLVFHIMPLSTKSELESVSECTLTARTYFSNKRVSFQIWSKLSSILQFLAIARVNLPKEKCRQKNKTKIAWLPFLSFTYRLTVGRLTWIIVFYCSFLQFLFRRMLCTSSLFNCWIGLLARALPFLYAFHKWIGHKCQ